MDYGYLVPEWYMITGYRVQYPGNVIGHTLIWPEKGFVYLYICIYFGIFLGLSRSIRSREVLVKRENEKYISIYNCVPGMRYLRVYESLSSV